MALDVVAFCISGNIIDNGGIVVGAPRGQTGTPSQYQINTYSTAYPTTGTIYSAYDTRFTGLEPCGDCGASATGANSTFCSGTDCGVIIGLFV